MSLLSPARPIPRASNACRQCLLNLRRQQPPTNHERLRLQSPRNSSRHLTNISGQKTDDNAQSVPRWAATPSAMKAPYRIRPRNDNDEFPVNEDPEKLYVFYDRFLGRDGRTWFDEGVKWLAITHKSFDYGRRGYNERLAFLGRRMMNLQTDLALLDRGVGNDKQREHLKRRDAYGRYPFVDPALEGISQVNIYQQEQVLDESRLAQLCERSGMIEVVRWKPRLVRDLKASGVDHVLTTTVYAIVGAVALQRGGQAANQFIQQKILTPIGVTS